MNEEEPKSQEGCGAETALTHRRLWIVLYSYTILPLCCPPECSPQPGSWTYWKYLAFSLRLKKRKRCFCSMLMEKGFNVVSAFKKTTTRDVTCCALVKSRWCVGDTCASPWSVFRPLQCDGISTEVCPINGSKPTWMLWWKRETCNLRGRDDARETAFLFVRSVDLDPFIPALSHCLHRVIILWIPTVWSINRCV